jgi:hypothetical protein
MNVGWLIAVMLVTAVVTAVWRRKRLLGSPGGERRVSEPTGGMVKRIEAYSFPVVGAALVIGALVYWDTWISVAGLAIGALFLLTGAHSLREVRRRRVEN